MRRKESRSYSIILSPITKKKRKEEGGKKKSEKKKSRYSGFPKEDLLVGQRGGGEEKI